MFELIFREPAVWGFLGAFIYAAPRLSACIFTARDTDGKWGRCAIEFIFAIVIGAIAAAAFQPMISALLTRGEEHDMRAIAAVLGLLSNRMASRLVEVVPDAVSDRLSRILKGGPK